MSEQENKTGIPLPGTPYNESVTPPSEREAEVSETRELNEHGLPKGFIPLTDTMKQMLSGERQKPSEQPHSELRFQGHIYHQTFPNSPPSGQELKFVRLIQSDEQPFGPRRIKLVEGEWYPLELQGSWITSCAYVILSNLEGRFFTNRPSKEEMQLLSEKIIEVAVLPEAAMENPKARTMFSPPKALLEPTPCALCPSGEDYSFTPALPLSRYRIRSLRGVILCSLTFFPGDS